MDAECFLVVWPRQNVCFLQPSSMNTHFPLCKEEEVTRASIHFGSSSYVIFNIATDSGGISNYTSKSRILETFDGRTSVKQEIDTGTMGDSIEKIINIYFQLFKEPIDCFSFCTTFLEDASGNSLNYEDPLALPKLKAAIAGRPIQVTLLFENSCMIPNTPVVKFLRDYIDYKMFVCNVRDGNAVELNDKMINCTFLSLKCDLSNPERLKEFKGWGLALENAEEKGFDFDFYYKVFENWFHGQPTQYRYLGLECSVDIEKWKEICTRGVEKEYESGFKYFEISREDGDICRIKFEEYYRDLVKRTKVIFFLGERTLEIDFFNMHWEPSPLINSGY